MDVQEAVGEQIEVAGAPAMAGLTFRRFRGPSDFAAIAAVNAASEPVDKVDYRTRVSDIEHFYTHLVHTDIRRDMLFVEVDGQVVGYNRGASLREENGPWIYHWAGVLKPEWRGRGLGTAALNYMEAHHRALAAAGAAAGERYFQAEAAKTETGREALLAGAGYDVARVERMMAQPLAGPGVEPVVVSPMPEGVEVRPVPPELYRAVWEADAEAFRDHWGYVPPTEADYERWLSSPRFNAALWKVAFDQASGQVAGMVLNFINQNENEDYNRNRGYTEGISVRRPWRRRGLARALLTRSLQMFQEMGMAEAALGVDSQNLSGAFRLYESVGFRETQRFLIYRKAF
jgi:ribosomal protein S18 acetylase RimI-like enzyme